MRYLGSQTLETDRLILRKYKLEDVPFAYKNWCSRDEVCLYTFWDKHENENVTKEFVSKIIELEKNDNYYHWVIVLKENKEPIGDITCETPKLFTRSCEVGYCLSNDCWGKGLMSEALKAVSNFMLNEVGVEKFIGRHIASNVASGKVMSNAGMQYEGVRKNYLVNKVTGKREDEVNYYLDSVHHYLNRCPACGKHWFEEKYEICPICNWENDPIQNEDPDFEGGANKLSLNEFKKELKNK